MRKHSRFFAVLLTSFFLVGIMAAAAAAVEYSIEGSNVATVQQGKTTTVNLTLKSTGASSSAKAAVSNIDVTLEEGKEAIVSQVESDVTSWPTSASSSNINKSIVISITGGTTNGTAKVTVEWNGQSHEINVTVITPVAVKEPVISGTPAAPTLTWGNAFTGFTLSDSTGQAGTWALVETDGEVTAALTAAGLTFDDANGKITLTQPEDSDPVTEWKPTATQLNALYNAINNTTDAVWNGSNMTYKFKISKTNGDETDGTKNAEKEFTFTFRGAALTIASEQVTSGKHSAFKYGKTIAADGEDVSTPLVITATGPGTISWDLDAINEALPKGLTATADDSALDTAFKNTLTVAGTPELTYKDYSVTFKASNTGSNTGAKDYTVKFTIETDSLVLKVVTPAEGETPEEDQATLPAGEEDPTVASFLPQGDMDVGNYVDGTVPAESDTTVPKIVLRAVPGPITWSGYDNLTATGLTITTSGDEYLVISGKYTTDRADTKDATTKYTIKAANKYQTGKSQEVSQNVMVWTKPVFDQTYVFHNTSDKKDKEAKTWGADFFKTQTALDQPIPVSKLPEAESWDVVLNDGTSEITALSWTPASEGGESGEGEEEGEQEPATDNTKLYVTDKSGNISKTHYLSAEVKNGVLYLTGSTDRVPANGKITVTVTARNHAGDTEKTYTVTVIGTTPTLAKKNDMTLSGYGKDNSADIAITAGDPTVVMTAKIEQKIAKKIFGIEKDIDLLADGPKYGIYVSGDMANGKLKIFLPDSNDNNGTEETQAHIASLVGNGETDKVYKGYAFKKLPIVITAATPGITYDAKNKTITDKKIATQKATLSTSNNTVNAYWVAPEAETLYNYGLSTALVSQDLGKKQVIYVPQKKALANEELFPDVEGNNPYYFDLVGHGPFDVVVKPTEKNGIKVAITDAVIDTDENGEEIDPYTRKRVTFTGTPSDTTKDVATAFSLTAKNPSTGKAAKLSVNFTAVPTPKVQEAKIGNSKEKPATVGKKVKVAPKITSNSKKIGWKIDSVEWNGTTFESDTVSQDLYDIWGLALDKKGKGSIEGTATAATGTTNPLTVVMHAYTKASDESEEELTTSDPVTATIYIAGEKPKLGTKKVTVTIDDTTGAYNFDESVFEIKKLNNASAPTEDNPVITALGENNKNHYVADMEPTETFSATAQAENTIAGNFDNDSKVVAAKGLSIVRAYSDLTAADSKYNTFKLDGEPAGATKKETVQIAMNNWGTIQTDKLTVTIVGQTPEVTASTESLTDLPETSSSAQKITFTVSNAGKVGSKIKWKITSKPSSGVKAKLVTDKSKPTQATVEITTKKATAGAETSVTVSATDSDTKKAGTAKVALTVKAAAETKTEDTPTVVDDTKAVEETKTEEKALGEGEVHFGRERTAAGLTAAQRKFLADNGYVIAAVLPEIEVTEAGGQYALEVDELEEAAATGAELVYFAFSNKPTDDDEIVTFADLETDKETTVIPESRKLIVEPWFNVGTKYAPVIAVKAAAGEAEAATEEDVKAKAEEKAEEAAAEGTEAAPEVELKEVKDKDAE